MRATRWWMAAVILASMAGAAWAGSGEKCSYAAQACLDHMAAKKTAGWAGMELDKDASGAMAVNNVIPGSPAAAAGFQPGDVLLTLNGADFADKEAVKKAKGDWKPGSVVSYGVRRGEARKDLKVTLGAMSEEVFAALVGRHMISDHMAVATIADAKETKPAPEIKAAAAEKK